MNRHQLIVLLQPERFPEFRIVAVRARHPLRRIPQCMNRVQDIHRRGARGKRLLDRRDLVARQNPRHHCNRQSARAAVSRAPSRSALRSRWARAVSLRPQTARSVPAASLRESQRIATGAACRGPERAPPLRRSAAVPHRKGLVRREASRTRGIRGYRSQAYFTWEMIESKA